jgi:hypothetical protein
VRQHIFWQAPLQPLQLAYLLHNDLNSSPYVHENSRENRLITCLGKGFESEFLERCNKMLSAYYSKAALFRKAPSDCDLRVQAIRVGIADVEIADLRNSGPNLIKLLMRKQ